MVCARERELHAGTGADRVARRPDAGAGQEDLRQDVVRRDVGRARDSRAIERELRYQLKLAFDAAGIRLAPAQTP